MSSKYEVKVFNTVEDIGKDSIDAISNDPFFTYGWLKTLEASKLLKSVPLYVAVYNENGLVAFLPCFIDLAGQYFLYGPFLPLMKRILDLSRKLGIYQDHVLMCYSPFCYRSKILLGRTSDRKLILGLLSRKIDELCREQRILFTSFQFISECDSFLTVNLQNYQYFKIPWWTDTMYLAVQWSTFEEYMSSLPRSSRKTVRREIRKCQERGVEITEEPTFGELAEKLSVLYSNLHKKYNPRSRSPFDPSFFRTLSEHTQGKAKVFVAKKAGEVVGFILLIRQKDVADAFIVGFEYGSFQSHTDFTYFNLFYEATKWAIKERIKRINYRFTAEEAKIRRGCSKEQIFSFVKCHNKLLNLFYNIYAKKIANKSKNCSL